MRRGTAGQRCVRTYTALVKFVIVNSVELQDKHNSHMKGHYHKYNDNKNVNKSPTCNRQKVSTRSLKW